MKADEARAVLEDGGSGGFRSPRGWGGRSTEVDGAAAIRAAAELYRLSRRCVQRWGKIGRDADDPAPVADPVAMCEWWERMKARGAVKTRPPEAIRTAAREKMGLIAGRGPALGSAAEAHSGHGPAVVSGNDSAGRRLETGATGAVPRPRLSADFDASKVSFMDSIHRLRAAVAQAQLDLEWSRDHDPEAVSGVLRALSEATDRLAAAEARKGRILAAEGGTLPRVEALAIIGEIAGSILRWFEHDLSRAREFLAPAVVDDGAWRAAISELTDAIRARAIAARFFDPGGMSTAA